MDRKNLFIVFLIPFLFFGCDGNFGVLNLFCTYLVINDIENSEVKLYCESEKIGISSLRECEEDTDEKTIDWLGTKELVDDNDFRVFWVPSIYDIKDRNKIDIYFKAEVNHERYEANLYIRRLQEDSNCYLFEEPVTLKTTSGKTLDAVFCYSFWRTI